MIRRRRPPLPDPPAGAVDYWVVVLVALHEPLVFEDPARKAIVGYYRCLGIRCEPDRLRELLSATVDDGTIDWPKTRVSKTDPASHDKDVRCGISLETPTGVWYESGKILFPSSNPTN
jgi:hypothetical protein